MKKRIPGSSGRRSRGTAFGPLMACLVMFPALSSFLARADEPAPRSTSTVGMPAKIEQLVLPGKELEAKPIEDRRAPLVLRIVDVYPHGASFRYDLVYYALEPGTYDLKDYMKRKDGSSPGELPPIPVKVAPALPPGQIEPHALALPPSPWLGGYRLAVAIGGMIWIAALALLLRSGRRHRLQAEASGIRPATLADRLRPLVESALAGTLSEGQHAELERLLIGYWRRRLELEDASPAKAISVMRNHPEAGTLLRRLEDWLHRPGPHHESVDLADLLRPYQDMMEETLGQGEQSVDPAHSPAGGRRS